jgi:hypothetical protein
VAREARQKDFFLEKKEAKTFTNCGRRAVQMAAPDAARNREKVF